MHYILAVAVLNAAPAIGVSAADTIDPVDVFMEDTINPSKLLSSTQKLVSTIYADAGVQIRWMAPTGSEEGLFHVRVVSSAPRTVSREALASTRIDQKTITVYYDRVRRRLGQAPPAVAQVALASVIAHELGHAIQGIPRHSHSGILKAHWTNDDFTAMLFNKLRFTGSDVALIRNGRRRATASRYSRSAQQEYTAANER